MIDQFSYWMFQEREYDVREVKKCSFDEILISPRMLADHMPNYLDEVNTQKMVSIHTIHTIYSLFPISGFQINRLNPLTCTSGGLAENLVKIAVTMDASAFNTYCLSDT